MSFDSFQASTTPTPTPLATYDSFEEAARYTGSLIAMQIRSPPKRKLIDNPESFLVEIPETPWRANDPRELAGHFRAMKLAGNYTVLSDDDDEMEVEVEQDARPSTKRRRETKRAGKAAGPLEAGNGNASSPLAETLNNQDPAQAQERSKRLKSPPPPFIRPDETENQGQDKSISPEDDDDESDPDVYGIAYIPTPTQRYARSQKRMQQIQNYKTRESREAREKRTAERRRRRGQSRTDAANAAATADDGAAKKKAVQFAL